MPIKNRKKKNKIRIHIQLVGVAGGMFRWQSFHRNIFKRPNFSHNPTCGGALSDAISSYIRYTKYKYIWHVLLYTNTHTHTHAYAHPAAESYQTDIISIMFCTCTASTNVCAPVCGQIARPGPSPGSPQMLLATSPVASRYSSSRALYLKHC